MVTILIMSAKLTSLELLEVKIFQHKSYDVIISDYDVIKNVLSPDPNYIVDVTCGQSSVTSISMKKVIINSIL